MTSEPRFEGDYSERQTTAAHRVLVDLGQVLASFKECVVVVGGWVPDLLLHDSTEQHVKSIDVDLALDAAKLTDGRYAELLALLLDTRRYERSDKPFQLFANVDLGDGQQSVRVDVDFLSPIEFKLRSRRSKKIEGFRVQQADGCGAAFRAPEAIIVEGRMVNGVLNSVELRVAALPDFLVMKCYALRGRDKPKDADDYGPRQVVEFHQSTDAAERGIQAQRAFQLVQRFLGLVGV
ncbi:MAG: hypothetical protein HY736_07665 [Verrucomicrobia bacterium]|nr:hypothetical protein [Verrucomicrobiota bacterium]